MKIEVDQNNILSIRNPNIPQTKEYTYNVWWYHFSDYDKWIIILHKKDRKIINLKNLGDGMSVVYCQNIIHKAHTFNDDLFGTALTIFHSFDEQTWETYSFVPHMWEKELQEKNEILKRLKTKYEIQKTEKWMIINRWLEIEKRRWSDTYGYLSFLFGLMIFYGKFDTKNWELASIKIQIPLFWEYMTQQNDFDHVIQSLQKEWIFLKVDKLTNKNGIIYQISSNDYELLEIFASRYEPVEKFTRITKREFTEDMKGKLIDFIQTNTEIPSEGKAEVLKKIKSWTIKFLTKN